MERLFSCFDWLLHYAIIDEVRSEVDMHNIWSQNINEQNTQSIWTDLENLKGAEREVIDQSCFTNERKSDTEIIPALRLLFPLLFNNRLLHFVDRFTAIFFRRRLKERREERALSGSGVVEFFLGEGGGRGKRKSKGEWINCLKTNKQTSVVSMDYDTRTWKTSSHSISSSVLPITLTVHRSQFTVPVLRGFAIRTLIRMNAVAILLSSNKWWDFHYNRSESSNACPFMASQTKSKKMPRS